MKEIQILAKNEDSDVVARILGGYGLKSDRFETEDGKTLFIALCREEVADAAKREIRGECRGANVNVINAGKGGDKTSVVLVPTRTSTIDYIRYALCALLLAFASTKSNYILAFIGLVIAPGLNETLDIGIAVRKRDINSLALNIFSLFLISIIFIISSWFIGTRFGAGNAFTYPALAAYVLSFVAGVMKGISKTEKIGKRFANIACVSVLGTGLVTVGMAFGMAHLASYLVTLALMISGEYLIIRGYAYY